MRDDKSRRIDKRMESATVAIMTVSATKTRKYSREVCKSLTNTKADHLSKEAR